MVEGQHKDGDAVVRNHPVLIGGVDGSGNAQSLLVGTDGSLTASVSTATFGSTSDAAAYDADGTLNAHLRGIAKVQNERTPAALGQTTMSASTPVTIASNQTAVAVSQSGTWTVTAASEPRLDVATDQVGAGLMTNVILDDRTELTPKFASITASSSGATTIVAAVTSKKIRVLSWSLVCNAAVNVKWQSHVTPTDKTGLHYFAANGGVSVGFSPVGHFETISGEALDINLSGNVAVGGSLAYVEV